MCALLAVAFVLGHFAHTFTHWSLLKGALLAGQMLLAFFVGGFLGKFLGLAIARARLRALCKKIQGQARQSSP
jgi:hypothetical protein